MSAVLDPTLVTYQDVEKLIHKFVWNFYKEFGYRWTKNLIGPFEEARSVATMFFFDAYLSYDHRKSTFNTWLGFKIRKGFLDMIKRGSHRRKLLKRNNELDLDSVCAREQPSFSLSEFLESLSEDARAVVRATLLDTPLDVIVNMKSRRLETPYSFKVALREYFKDMGWSATQVASAFLEIREALSQ